MNQSGRNLKTPQRLTVSIIVPVYNGGMNFQKCLARLVELDESPAEIIVVADGDTDGSWRFAQQYGTEVIRIPESKGPACARNMGALKAKGDILFFVDSDVIVAPNAIGKIITAFQEDSDIAALFGSYDDQPGETNFLSQYKNLFHHYVHQTGNEDASTFWGACGAIRRKNFLKLGGFDERYRHPSIEDIDLGYRLKRNGGKIRLLKDLRVKHLKRWAVKSLLKADIVYRALPWSRLIMEKGRFIDDLNLKISSRLSVIFVFLMAATIIAGGFIPSLLVSIPILATGIIGLNWDLYRFFKKKRGLGFMLKMIPWHWLYFFYSGLSFALSFIRYHIQKPPFFHRQNVGTSKPIVDR